MFIGVESEEEENGEEVEIGKKNINFQRVYFHLFLRESPKFHRPTLIWPENT